MANIYHIYVPWFFLPWTWIDKYSKNPMHSSHFLGAFLLHDKTNVHGWTSEHLRSLGFMWKFRHFTDRKNGSLKNKNCFLMCAVFFLPRCLLDKFPCFRIWLLFFSSVFFLKFIYAGIPNSDGLWHYEWWLMTGHVTRIHDDTPPGGFIMTHQYVIITTFTMIMVILFQ